MRVWFGFVKPDWVSEIAIYEVTGFSNGSIFGYLLLILRLCMLYGALSIGVEIKK